MNINNLSSDTFQKVPQESQNLQKGNTQTGLPSAAIISEEATVSDKAGSQETKPELITQTSVESNVLIPNEAPHDLTVGVSSPKASPGAEPLRSETSSHSSPDLRPGFSAKGDKKSVDKVMYAGIVFMAISALLALALYFRL